MEKEVCGYVYIGLYLCDVSLYSIDQCLLSPSDASVFSVASHVNWLKKKKSQICINQVPVQSNFISTLDDNQI